MKKFLKIFALAVVACALLFAAYFYLIKKLDRDAQTGKDFYTAVATGEANPYLLPGIFIDGQRFYIKIGTAKGDTLWAFGDTGGGLSFITPGAAQQYGLGPLLRSGLSRAVMPLQYIPFYEVAADHRIPAPIPLRNAIIRHPFSIVKEPVLIVVPEDEPEFAFMLESMGRMDAFLGQNFFMRHAWTFDYPHQQIWVNTPLKATDAGKQGVQKMVCKKNAYGEAIYGHPSMKIEVDGEVIDVLFDTGATMVLTEEGKKALHTEKKTLAASFIARSVLSKWRKAHPDWKYYPKADKAGDVIEVPLVKIGGYEAGPVLFAQRPDESWSEYMIATMDKVVKGALGGSALQYFKVTADYNNELIRFER